MKHATAKFESGVAQDRTLGQETQDFLRKDLTAWVGNLEGQWLTIVDATFNDPEQRRAMKNIVRKMIWEWDEALLDSHIPNRRETNSVPPRF